MYVLIRTCFFGRLNDLTRSCEHGHLTNPQLTQLPTASCQSGSRDPQEVSLKTYPQLTQLPTASCQSGSRDPHGVSLLAVFLSRGRAYLEDHV